MRRVVFSSLTVILSVAGVLLALEGIGAARLHYHHGRHEPELPEPLRGQVLVHGRAIETVPDPYLLFRVKPDLRTEHVQTNRFGLRNGPIEIEPRGLRVLLLGGSTAWGYSARSNDETIAAYLQAYLRVNGERAPALRDQPVEVLNGGVFGYVSWQEALAYAVYHRKLRPDVVVVLDGANDVYSAILHGRAGLPIRFDASRKPYLKPVPAPLETLVSWLRYRVERMRFVRALRISAPAQAAPFEAPPAERVAAAYRDALTSLADLTRADGVLLLAVLQPIAILPGLKPLTAYEEAVVAEHERKIPGRNAYYAEVYDELRDVLTDLARERPEMLSFDATSIYRNDTQIVYTDYCHLVPHGRQELARVIGDRLLEALEQSGVPEARPRAGS
ncbi:MAG: GDSL-type esterase/lipase family protein [Myxococcota bacterium]